MPHGTPSQPAAAQVFDAQDLPVQPAPATGKPIHEPPDHAVLAALRGAQEKLPSSPQGLISPMSRAPLLTTWLDPRDPSNCPVPLDAVYVWVPVGVAAATAAATLTSWYPLASGVPVLLSSFLT